MEDWWPRRDDRKREERRTREGRGVKGDQRGRNRGRKKSRNREIGSKGGGER